MTKLEKEILGYLSAHESEATFYHVVRRFISSFLHGLPSIIADLKNLGWVVENNQSEDVAFPLLQITNQGRAVLRDNE
ncbi:MAG: hypothetical protein JAY64_04585 [Candidatus Thiodiazotropha weberae]|nr:hypothetical protein [Candidatus Thiodiazotropha lotti]MCG8010963.1 hypothetical protein [Candidatus Thiodiazotropha lotti]MCW4210426.1 hypothetical protein [Candidatus Thiodiazotropha lotti]MCW4217187.1 hypothetical protein [Candidatus Thiodiazotropha lotti]